MKTNNAQKEYGMPATLLKKAHEAKAEAYAPYSGFQVGAALRTHAGRYFTGCNVENAAYGSSMCAERVAIFKAVSEGYGPGDFTHLAVAANAEGFSPCGACRQVMAEFGVREVIFEWHGQPVVAPLETLLPHAFTLTQNNGDQA
jgi:cytidine deaminase